MSTGFTEIAKRMANTGDTVMADAAVKSQSASDTSDLLQTTHCDAFAFTDPAKLALELYDQLREIELQQSLLQAQKRGMSCRCTSPQTQG